MLVIVIAVIGVVVGILAHLILGLDGYSWFGEIIIGIGGAAVFGMVVGILAGARELMVNPAGALENPAAIQVIVAGILGAILVEAIIILLTFRAVGRGFGRA